MPSRKRPRPPTLNSGRWDWTSPRVKLAAGGLLIAVLCLWAYSPSLHGDFLLDDNILLTHNKMVHASNGLARFWFSTDPTDYWPLTNSAFWLQWRLWGLHPTGYHVTNLLLHIGAVYLLWAILRKLSIPGAYLAALLFAVHPVNVESVAWISQLKNALAMVFFLLSIWWYLKAEEGREARGEGRGWYWLSLLAFVLAMLSKGSVAVLPVVLMMILWWRRRIARVDLVRLAPFFVVSGALTAVNMWFQTHGKEVAIREVTLPQRLAGAGAAVWFYLAKAIAPIELAFIYPNWAIGSDLALWWLPLAAAIAITVALVWNCKRSATSVALPVLFAWALFCVALLPMLGFADVGFMKFSLVADHYQHAALIAVVALAAAAWAAWYRQARGGMRTGATIVAGFVVAALAILTWNRNQLYADPVALYSATLKSNPDCWIAQYNLGNSFTVAGRSEQALEYYRKALALKPDDPEILTNTGIALGTLGRSKESFEYLQKALQVMPDYAPAENNIGFALTTAGRPQEAIEHLQHAIKLDPDYPAAELNLGAAWLALGRIQEAVECFQRALQLNPEYAEAYYNLGNVAAAVQDWEKAKSEYRSAVRINPKYAEAYNNLGSTYFQAGQASEAITPFQQALRIQPNYVEAHCNLAKALAQVGRVEEAIAHFQRGLQLRPDVTTAWMGLATSYAAVQRPREAISAAESALKAAQAQEQTAESQQIEEWLAKYRAQQQSAAGTSSRAQGAAEGP